MALQRKIPRGGGLPGFLRHLPLAQGLGTAVAWLAGCKWPDPELLASPDEAISTAEQIAAGHFNAMTYFVSMSVTLAGFLFYRRRRHGPTVVARFSRRGLNPVLLLWGCSSCSRPRSCWSRC
ncbi:MAG: hypothetical protein ACLUQ6_03150 [Alistipes onderdonkii]